jgi:hypothetical protein
MALASDAELQGRKGMALVSIEPMRDGATQFVVSAPIENDADAARVQKRVEHHLRALCDGAVPTVPMLAAGLAMQMSEQALDPAALRGQGLPAQVTEAMLLGNMALQRALLEWRHKDLAGFAAEVRTINGESVSRATRRYLADEHRTTLLLEPGDR